MSELENACGSPNGSDYEDEPESGKTGYYYYDTQNPPRTQAEFDALPKYVAFPNCSSFTTNFDDPDDLGSAIGRHPCFSANSCG